MNFFGNFGGGFGRPSWSPLGGNSGSFGNGGMIVGGNMGPFGSGIDHGSLPHVTQPSLASTFLDTNPGMHVTSSAATTLETIFPRAEVGTFCPTVTPPCMGAPYVGISMPSPVRDLGDRLSLSVPSMEMRPEVAVAPAPPTPTVVPVIEKCEITPPAKGITSSVSANGPTETVAPKQSFWGRAKRFVERGFSNVGDFVAGEEPVILPTGKDYLMGDDIREKAAPMEAKAAAASAVLIAAAVEAAGAGGAAGAVGKVGTKVIARAIKSGDSVSSFARKTDGMDLASKAGLADRPALIERKVDIPGIPKESAVKQTKVQQTVSSFKPIREIPKDATHSGVFHKEVEFTYKKTGQTFKVTQRNDIDPNYVVTLKDGKQVTNRELMREGKAPRTNLGAKVILHHIGQDAKGPLTEVTEYSHLDALHGQYGVNEPHPTNPVIRKIFDPIREAYWKTYGETFK